MAEITAHFTIHPSVLLFSFFFWVFECFLWFFLYSFLPPIIWDDSFPFHSSLDVPFATSKRLRLFCVVHTIQLYSRVIDGCSWIIQATFFLLWKLGLFFYFSTTAQFGRRDFVARFLLLSNSLLWDFPWPSSLEFDKSVNTFVKL